MNPGGGVIKLHLERTFGQWRKVGFLCGNSENPDGTVGFTYHYQNGLVDIDGISVRAVTDREADALNNFLKGSEAE
jgi:hypothetical protein